MKHFGLYILLSMLALAGCTDDYCADDYNLSPSLIPHYLHVKPTSLSFKALPTSSQSINVETETPWTVNNAVDWISLSSTSGQNSSSIDVCASENEDADNPRAGVFYVNGDMGNDWKPSICVSVSQAAPMQYINVENTSITLNGAACSESFDVSANCAFSVLCICDWLTAEQDGNKVTISATANASSKYRTTTITLISKLLNKVTATVTISQAPAAINASTETLSFGNAAGEARIDVTAETTWKASTSFSWINVSPESGEVGTSTLTISVAPNTSVNEREGYVLLYVGSEKRIQIPIKQSGMYIDVDKTSMSFVASGESQTIHISSNTNWTINDCPSWASLSQSEGNGDATVTITVQDNPSVSSRSGKIKVTQEGVTIGSYVSLTQAGKQIDVSSQLLTFGDEGGTQSIVVSADDSWEILNDKSWISVSPLSGSGNGSVSFMVSENETDKQRQGTIYLTMLNKTIDIQVEQKAKIFSIETATTSLTFPAAQSSSVFSIECNTSWTLSGYPSWTGVSQQSGTGNADITVTAEENPYTNDRTGSISLSMAGKTTAKTIALRQYGKYFSLSPTSLEFTDKEGTQDVTIETDGEWNATTSNSWIKLSPSCGSKNSTLSISVTENVSDAERTGNVFVTIGTKTLNVPVHQKAKYFTVDDNSLTYASKGGSIGITVSTNDTWTAYAEEGSSWLTLSKTSGAGAAQINVIAGDNASVNERTGYVVIETPHNQSVRIKVTQKARYLTASTNELLFFSKGGTSSSIIVSTDGTFSISCSDSWLNITRSGDTFIVTASENETKDVRIGKITISLTDLKEGSYSVTLTVTQSNYGGTFLRKDFDADNDYDSQGASTGSLTIIGYGSDTNYDTSSPSETKLSLVGFRSDSNWDNSASSGAKISITGYKSDQNLDSTTSSSGTVSKRNYSSDGNWN